MNAYGIGITETMMPCSNAPISSFFMMAKGIGCKKTLFVLSWFTTNVNTFF
jgi:hypothetical protein